MNNDYIFTEAEYAKIIGISKEGVRSRRRDGKLEGQYIQKDSRILYARPRPNQGFGTAKTAPRNRRRGAHNRGQTLQYPNNAFKQHNEVKMLAKLKADIDPETLDLVPEAIEIAKKKKQERVRETLDSVRKPAKTTYSSGLYNPKYVTPTWRSLDAKKKTKQFNYY
mgnify:FL=1|jgi:hypothetical protein|tara:strand:- start:275 stop:772 length:498 start_codon:yes stop_codon:yes gene_type:complete